MKLLKAEDVAEICGVNIRKAYEIMDRCGPINLSGNDAKKNRRIMESDLERYLTSKREAPTAAHSTERPRTRTRAAEPPKVRVDKDGHHHGPRWIEVFGKEATA